MSLPPLHLRQTWPFWVVVALLIGIGVNNIVQGLADWHLHDMNVYRDAARRITAGEPLYGGDVTPLNAYRYAPWFAYAWIPLAGLPDPVVNVGWSLLLLAASAACLRPVVGRSRERVALALLFGPILFGISANGNVQPLVVAALVYGLSTRWGWLAVGVTASLKVVPLAFVAVFLCQRRWRQAIGASLLAAALWAPIALFTIDAVTLDPGPARTLTAPIWLVVALGSAAVTLWLAYRRSRFTTLAAATAAILALPRLFLYEITLLMPAIPPDEAES